ncbi:MAG: spermidine/putrescine ABC transporter ATP-binding protein [Chloroflexi bacterium HGW-Chloroflexi-8]|nr:MAG: spermidine/putrescine ABC transporter ATP-binding protein [Chloroflexi bacterium HGW-Chloroflexi-8]
MVNKIIEFTNVSKQYRERTGETVNALQPANLDIYEGEFFTLLGPSGCGKTTALRLMAGFIQPTSGKISIRGQAMNNVPPYKRPVNMVFQDYALFPHLNVFENVAFGLRIRRTHAEEIRRRVHEALEIVQLVGFDIRRPSELSGGQKQRVALARALVNEPAVLLLDEPLGALDLKLRRAMQIELKTLQQRVGITFVYVTHDQEEALTMSDRIAVMSGGNILQVDTPVNIYDRPTTRFVADFVGETNFLTAKIQSIVPGETVKLAIGSDLVDVRHRTNGIHAGDIVTVAIRPEKLALIPNPQNVEQISATISEITFLGTDTRYLVTIPSGEKAAIRVQNTGKNKQPTYHIGEQVKISYEMDDAQILTN